MRDRCLSPYALLYTVALLTFHHSAKAQMSPAPSPSPAAAAMPTIIHPEDLAAAQVSLYFSPGSDVEKAVLQQVAAAKKTIWLEAYAIESVPLAQALLDSHLRGVEVKLLLDKSITTAYNLGPRYLILPNVTTLVDGQHQGISNDVMIIDGVEVLTGSLHFTEARDKNYVQNLLMMKNAPPLVRAFEENFRFHAHHSQLVSITTGKTHLSRQEERRVNSDYLARLGQKLKPHPLAKRLILRSHQVIAPLQWPPLSLPEHIDSSRPLYTGVGVNWDIAQSGGHPFNITVEESSGSVEVDNSIKDMVASLKYSAFRAKGQQIETTGHWFSLLTISPVHSSDEIFKK